MVNTQAPNQFKIQDECSENEDEITYLALPFELILETSGVN